MKVTLHEEPFRFTKPLQREAVGQAVSLGTKQVSDVELSLLLEIIAHTIVHSDHIFLTIWPSASLISYVSSHI